MTTPLVKDKITNLCNTFLTADNKNAFRRYKGIEVLAEMLNEHKNVTVTKALIHVLEGSGKCLNIIILTAIKFRCKL